MKKLFLVKGDERHEVEIIDERYNFCALGHMITPAVAVLLGYELQEVKREERAECWMVVGSAMGSKAPYILRSTAEYHQFKYGGTIKHMVALEDDERIVSRVDLERAWDKANHARTRHGLNKTVLLKELGFGEER